MHGEEKREEGDRSDQEERGGIKREESSLASNQFPICSPQSGTLKRGSQSSMEKREEGDSGDQEERRGRQKERNQSSQ